MKDTITKLQEAEFPNGSMQSLSIPTEVAGGAPKNVPAKGTQEGEREGASSDGQKSASYMDANDSHAKGSDSKGCEGSIAV
jgi:hypothetical protein